ncbi:MAG: AbrB family transcriptional regulator, partial [Hyphomicrobiales bacterium]|nr:AbrB family transcriptional regulator [Hyphomicrobiales bacterium]
AAVYALTPLPLPWFLGAMLACLIAIALRAPVAGSSFATLVMRIVLGLAIGSAFSPEMTDRAGEMAVSLAFVFPYVLFLGLLGYPYFRAFRDYDRITALLASVPGGFQTMVAIGEDCGADLRRLSIVHSTRILVIVFFVPIWIQFTGSADLGNAIPTAASFSAINLKEALVLVVCGIGGYWLAKGLRISGAAIIGPMLANGAVHMAGLAEARVPVELVNAAQLVIGVHIGCQFAGITLRELFSTVSIAFGYSVILMLGAAVFTVLVVWATGLDQNAVALAYAPGGQPEMNLIALVLDFDPAYVALHHLLRVMVIVIGAQFLISWLIRAENRESKAR